MLAHVEPSAFSRTMSATTAQRSCPPVYSPLVSGVLRNGPGMVSLRLTVLPQRTVGLRRARQPRLASGGAQVGDVK
jgi:hypothetical protein